jgi:acyl-CoA reductase-like NAD-dependent aldehyde dehydrogenase
MTSTASVTPVPAPYPGFTTMPVGVKASGIGRFGGQWAVDEFTTEHWVTVQRTPRPFPTG